jgi:hypothetical protein
MRSPFAGRGAVGFLDRDSWRAGRSLVQRTMRDAYRLYGGSSALGFAIACISFSIDAAAAAGTQNPRSSSAARQTGPAISCPGRCVGSRLVHGARWGLEVLPAQFQRVPNQLHVGAHATTACPRSAPLPDALARGHWEARRAPHGPPERRDFPRLRQRACCREEQHRPRQVERPARPFPTMEVRGASCANVHLHARRVANGVPASQVSPSAAQWNPMA